MNKIAPTITTISVDANGVFEAPQASHLDGDMGWSDGGAFGSSRTDSGERVSPSTAIMHGPVWQAINILAGDVGQMPVHKMRRKGREISKDRRHAAERLLVDEPNGWQTPSELKEFLMQSALLWGNGICGIVRDQARRPIGLIPFMPSRTRYDRLGDGSHWIMTRLGGARDEETAVPASDTIHLRGLASDGFWGLSAVDVARNVIGHGLALEKHGNKTFKNGATPSGVLQTEATIDNEVRRRMRDEWQQVYSGSDNAGRVLILQGGLSYEPISMSNADAQWLEARKVDREFIASIFNVPAFKLNALDNGSVRGNLEEQNKDYFMTSLARWTNKLAEEFRRKLLTIQERKSGNHFFRWFPEAFLRGDTGTRFATYATAIGARIMSPNEAREKEDLNPYDGGDEFLNPAIDTIPEGGEAADVDEVVDVDEAAEAVESLIKTQVAALLTAEVQRTGRMARDPAKRQQLKEFYTADRFEAFAEPYLAASVGVARLTFQTARWRDAIQRHAGESLTSWLSDASARQTIAGRCDQLTQDILGEEKK